MKGRVLTHEELETLLVNWEGGEIVDRDLLIRELAKVFRRDEAKRSLEELI